MMDSNTLIITLIYYAGIASCAAQGAKKGENDISLPFVRYITNSFGGGFVRDLVFLNVYPWILTQSAFFDIVFVVICGILFSFYLKNNNLVERINVPVSQFVILTDAFGLGSFICIGMDKAFSILPNLLTVLACGYVTAIGGGIIANGKKSVDLLRYPSRDTIIYHTITILGCLTYYVTRNSLITVYVTVVGLLLTSIDYTMIIDFVNNSFLYEYCRLLYLYHIPIVVNHVYTTKRFTINDGKIQNWVNVKIYILHHRIRQC